MKVMVFIYLLVNSWNDYKTREIDLRYTVLFFGILLWIDIWKGDFAKWEGIFPGILLGGFSLISREKIGSGDSWVVMAVGCAVGLTDIWKYLLIAFVIVAGIGLFCVLFKRNQEGTLPFVPFLLLSFCVGGIL